MSQQKNGYNIFSGTHECAVQTTAKEMYRTEIFTKNHETEKHMHLEN